MSSIDIVALALISIKESQGKKGQAFDNPRKSADFCTLRLAQEDKGQEHFLVLYLDNQHQLIEDRIEFHGTIDGAAVYPRIVAKRALELDAAAVIFSHNHPSGICEASHADKQITAKLKNALGLFDIRVLDHVIVAGPNTYSFAEHGDL